MVLVCLGFVLVVLLGCHSAAVLSKESAVQLVLGGSRAFDSGTVGDKLRAKSENIEKKQQADSLV